MLALTIAARNTGFGTWRPDSRSGIGHVTCGVQLLDESMRLVARDHHRLSLPRAIGPGETVTLTGECPLPAIPGRYGLKVDLVAEGMTWFETAGSRAVSHVVEVK